MNDQQRALLLFINERIQTTGVSPTMHEMAGAIGNKHRSGAHRYLALLESEGWIRRTARRRQSIEVLRVPGKIARADPVHKDVVARLAAELSRRNAALDDVQCAATVFAGWILETIEAAGFRLLDVATRSTVPERVDSTGS